MSTVLRYLANRSPNPAENPDIAAHRTRMLRISEIFVACGACGVAGEGGAECDNATMRQCSNLPAPSDCYAAKSNPAPPSGPHGPADLPGFALRYDELDKSLAPYTWHHCQRPL